MDYDNSRGEANPLSLSRVIPQQLLGLQEWPWGLSKTARSGFKQLISFQPYATMEWEGPAKVGMTQPLPYPSRPHVTLQHAQKHNLDHHGVQGRNYRTPEAPALLLVLICGPVCELLPRGPILANDGDGVRTRAPRACAGNQGQVGCPTVE